MELREYQLTNGLDVIAECNPRAYSTALAFFVNTGARDETPDVAGVSHFLEHMTFKGTPRRSAEDVNRELDELGSHSNAYTSEEQTVYYATVLPEYQDATLDLLADIMRPSLRQEDFEMEKSVILEEILKYEDQPPFGAHEKCMAAFFGDHPLGNNILGTTESVSALTAEAMKEYFRQRYSPGNMTLVATGNVDFDALVRAAENHCGTWPEVKTQRTVTRATGHAHCEVLQKDNAMQQYAVLISAGPAAEDEDRHAGRVLATIFGDDTGSRLYWDLVDNGLCEYAGTAPYEFQGTGIFMSFLCCTPDRFEANLDIVRAAQARIGQDGITADELELAKNKLSSQLVRQSERPSNRIFSVGNAWLQRRSYQTVKQRLAALQAVDLEAVHRVLEKHPLHACTTVAVGP